MIGNAVKSVARGWIVLASAAFFLTGCKTEPMSIQFGANPGIIEHGQSSTLTWNVAPANGQTLQGVTIEPAIGTVNPSGNVNVSPNQTTDYILKAFVVDQQGNQQQREKKVTLLVQQGVVWNWQRNDVFRDFNNIQILAPWAEDQHFGVDVTRYTHPPEDGWRLYIKRLTCSDYIEGCDDRDLPQYEDRRNFPYFALYNAYTGVMRIFVYINKPNFTGSKELLVTTSILESGMLSDFGLSLQESDYTLPLEHKDAQQNHQVSVLKSFVNKWAVIERTFSYDPTTPPTNLSLNLFFEERQIQDVDLTGTFQFSLASQQSSGGKGVLSAVMKAPRTVKKNIGDIKDAGMDIVDVAEKLNASRNLTLPEGFIGRAQNFGNFLINNSGTLGGFVGGLDVVSSLSNLFGRSSSMQYGSGTITLTGTIVNQFPQNQISIGLSDVAVGSNPSIQAAAASNEVPTLGLFSFKQTPKVWVQPRCANRVINSFAVTCNSASVYIPGNDGEWVRRFEPVNLYLEFENNFAELLELNPVSNMVLQEIMIEPSINIGLVTHTVWDSRYDIFTDIVTAWAGGAADFERIVRVGGILSRPIGTTFLGKRFIRDGESNTLHLSAKQADGGQTSEDTIGLTCNPCRPSVSYKVFMRFVHKDELESEAPRVYAEYIQTLKAEVILGRP